MSLNARQQRFVEEYLVDLNGSQAAIRAGYSSSSAKEIASQNLTKPEIQEAITEARAKMAERTQITQDMVLKEFARLGFHDIRTLFDEQERLKPISQLTRDQAAAVSSIKVVTKVLPSKDGQPADVEYIHEIKVWDKTASLTQIGRHLGMFTDKIETKDTTEIAARLEKARARQGKK